MPADAGRRYRGRIFEMDIMEIVLLIAGGIVFILSFLVPMKKEEDMEETRGLAKEEIKALVSEELEAVRGHVDDVVEEAVTYSIEKTERSLERLSNEKIMAVNEYSDTVLAEIHKNHEEVMFLYDMLNDKHINLKNTVSEVNRTVKEVKETKKEAEEVVNTFQRLAPETVIPLTTPVSVAGPQAFAMASQEPVESVLPPVFAAAPVVSRETAVPQFLMTGQPSAGQKAVATPQNTGMPRNGGPMPQKVSMAARQAAPAPQQVAPASHHVQPVPQQVAASRQNQPVPGRVAAGVRQIPQASAQGSPAPRKVVSASRQVTPPPQKVAFPSAKREGTAQTPVMPQVSAAPQSIVPEQSFSGTVQGGGSQASGVMHFTQETDGQGRNYNDRVLELYKSGKSNVAIARELNLGVGEVKLVIDLYKNRSEK